MPSSCVVADHLTRPPRPVRPDHVVVFGGWALGSRWLEAYDGQPIGERSAPIHLVRRVPGRLHPRLLLPFGLLLWAIGEAPHLAVATSLVARMPPEEAAALVYARPVELPIPCAGAGRCRVQVRNGQMRRTGSEATEDVAVALLHRAPCGAASSLDRTSLPDWATCWLEDSRSVGELAAHSARWLQRASTGEVPDLLDRLAGATADETALRAAYEEKRRRDHFRQQWGGHKRFNHHGSRGRCSACGSDFYPADAACHNCAAYPLGPDQQSSDLDRLERDLGGWTTRLGSADSGSVTPPPHHQQCSRAAA